MSTRTRRPGGLRRRLGFDGNPLRPAGVRVHAVVRIVFAVILVACACVGVDAGASTYDRADARTHQQRADPVTAGRPPVPMTAALPAEVGLHDRHSEAPTSPPRRTGAFTAAVGVGTTTALQLAVAPLVGYVAFRYGLHRVRRAACDREWSAVEPQWRRQLL